MMMVDSTIELICTMVIGILQRKAHAGINITLLVYFYDCICDASNFIQQRSTDG